MKRTLVVVCGLSAEAAIAKGDDVTTVAGGGDARRLAARLDEIAPQARGFLSFGVAGGLQPGLRPGDVRVAHAVYASTGEFQADQTWAARLADALGVPAASFAAADTPAATVAAKMGLFQASGAATVDMETHIVAEVAARRGVRWAGVRAVSDPAERALPHAATVGMRADGRVDLAAILTSLAGKPGQLPALIRTGLDARKAFAALLRCRQLLGPGFALLDL